MSGDNTGLLERLTLDATDVGDGVVISKYHEWIKCTSKCFKDNNKASHFIPQLWITFSDLCQTLKKNSNSADLCHIYH
jgi:hypothetical protein